MPDTAVAAPAVAAPAEAYRVAAVAIRGLHRAPQPTRNRAARAAAADRHGQALAAAEAALLDAGARDLLGLLVEEQQLAARVQDAHATGRTRPDLTGRLRGVRAQIRAHTTATP